MKNNTKSQIIIYQTDDGQTKINVNFRDETVWLTQAKIAELFDVDRSVITKHLQNIFKENELDKKSTSAKIAQVQREGNRQITRSVIINKNLFFTYPILFSGHREFLILDNVSA